MAKSKSYEAYNQVAVPSAGGTVRAGKDSKSCDDALGTPSRFSRVQGNATPAPDSKLDKTRDQQLGTNIELNWKRYGHDKMNPKGNVDFKKNFSNPTDNPTDLKVKE